MTRQSSSLAYTVRYHGFAEVLYDSDILFSRYIPGDKTPQQARTKCFYGIWDTGASATCISSRVVSDLALQPIGKIPVGTAAGIVDSYQYILSLWLPNQISIPGIIVSECELSGGLDCLIGMDVIRLGDFCVSNFRGNTTMSFRIPSIHETDYTLHRRISQKR